ncbi:MAG: cytochrome c biogenesis protein ResB [Holophagaceae bacterium]
MADSAFLKRLKPLASLQLTILLIALLMGLVVACTLAQVHLGVFGAVKVYMRGFLVWWGPEGASWKIPVAPGGALVGLLLLINLTAAMFVRLEFSVRKGGLWLSHIGLILLFAGEFISGGMQIESHMPIKVGQTMNYGEDLRHVELAAVDAGGPGAKEDTVYAIHQRRLTPGTTIADPRLPYTVKVVKFMTNSRVQQAPFLAGKGPATAGAGTEVIAEEVPNAPSEEQNTPSLYAELSAGGKSLGTWLFSTALLPQTLELDGRKLELALRLRRVYVPYTLTLKEFHHDVYPGTQIPKNFSSLVRLKDAETGEDRDVLVYMNHPLRYRGSTFFQASFGENDTLSILQVVQNPGWRIPYIACILVAAGLAWHFLARLAPARRTS